MLFDAEESYDLSKNMDCSLYSKMWLS